MSPKNSQAPSSQTPALGALWARMEHHVSLALLQGPLQSQGVYCLPLDILHQKGACPEAALDKWPYNAFHRSKSLVSPPTLSLRNTHLGIFPEENVGPLWPYKPTMTPETPLCSCVPGPLKAAWPLAGHRAVENPRPLGSYSATSAHLAVEASITLRAGALIGTIAVLAGATVQTGP